MLNDLPLGPLERALVDSLQRLDPQASPVVLASAALLCMALDKGDVCLPLARFAGQRPWPEHELRLPALSDWQAQLEASPLVGGDGDFTPLTLEHGRLYLARYQAYERHLATQLLQRAAHLELTIVSTPQARAKSRLRSSVRSITASSSGWPGQTKAASGCPCGAMRDFSKAMRS